MWGLFKNRRRFVKNEAVSDPPASDSTSALPPLDHGAAPDMAPPVPGCLQFEMYGKEWMQILNQDSFEGFRLESALNNSKYLQTMHSVHLGKTGQEAPYSYSFGPMFRTEDEKTLLMATVGLDRSVNFRAIQKAFEDAVEMRLQAQSHLGDPQRNGYEIASDVNLKGFAGNMKFAYQGLWVASSSVSQAVTSKLHCGADLTVLFGPLGGASMGSLGARFADGKDIWSVKLERSANLQKPPPGATQEHSVKAQYTRKISDRLSLGTEFEYKVDDNSSALRLGYEYLFRTAMVRGLIDTAGKVCCTMQDSKGLGFSGMIDYVNEDYKFGMVYHHQPIDEQAAAAAQAQQQGMM